MAHGRGHVQESVDDGVVVQQREGCEDLEAMVPADQQARTPVEQGHPGQNMVAPLDEDDVGPVVGVCDPSGGRDPGPRGDEVVARPDDLLPVGMFVTGLVLELDLADCIPVRGENGVQYRVYEGTV